MDFALREAFANVRIIGPHEHSPLVEAREDLGAAFDEVFKFAFVRNPWDRMVSWYSFLATISARGTADPQVLQDPESSHWRAFEEHLEAILTEKAKVDGVERPAFSQVHQLADAQEQLLTDAIGRFENFQADATDIFAKAGLRVPQLSHLNASARLPYSTYYSLAGREMVAEACALDIKTFGYEF